MENLKPNQDKNLAISVDNVASLVPENFFYYN